MPELIDLVGDPDIAPPATLPLDCAWLGVEGGSLVTVSSQDLIDTLIPEIPTGAAGRSAYQIAVDDGFSGTESEWLLSLTGPQGTPGTGIAILGAYATVGDLEAAHPAGSVGDGYMVAADLYVWSGSGWENVGPIQGPQGNDGVSGRTILSGTIDPTTEGANGDFYLNAATMMLFGPKASGSWPGGVLLIGDPGLNGQTILSGEIDPTTEGMDGDYYINISSWAIFGPRISGTWPVGPSLVGLAGADGTDGASAYEVAVDNGFIGSEAAWLSSLVGPAGADGEPGPSPLEFFQSLSGYGIPGRVLGFDLGGSLAFITLETSGEVTLTIIQGGGSTVTTRPLIQGGGSISDSRDIIRGRFHG